MPLINHLTTSSYQRFNQKPARVDDNINACFRSNEEEEEKEEGGRGGEEGGGDRMYVTVH